jgi:hypothetical protein
MAGTDRLGGSLNDAGGHHGEGLLAGSAQSVQPVERFRLGLLSQTHEDPECLIDECAHLQSRPQLLSQRLRTREKVGAS